MVLSELKGVIDGHAKLVALAEATAERPAMEENLKVMRRPAAMTPLSEPEAAEEADVQELPRSVPGPR